MSIYDYKVRGIFGDEISISNYSGKVMLIVNTASKCGFTPQFQGLEKLYKDYEKEGLVVLGFPCNQFKEQELGSNEAIQNFCSLNYGVTFPMFSKIDVNGKYEDPLYTFLKKHKGGFMGSKIKWNFTKFLVDRKGNVVKRYSPTTKPEDIEGDIIELLKK